MPSRRRSASNPVETEAKIRVASFGPIRRKISALGGRLKIRRTLERNTLLDAAGGPLRAAGKSFRVRSYGDTGAITLKGVARVVGGIKSRQELETEVASPEMLARILNELGFRPQFQYEKFREVWELDQSVICLDETPIGRFAEIEGAAREIHRVASLLGLSPECFLSDSYPALWFAAGRTGDMVFGPKRGPRRAQRAGESVRRSRA